MNLKQLLSGIPVKRMTGTPEVEIKGLAYSSREVKPGYLFAAMPGFKTNGHLFIPDAVQKGASAILCEDGPSLNQETGEGATVIQVENARRAFAGIACRFFGEPSRSLGLIGVTGTNGKTTTSFLIRSLLEHLGPAGLLGTVGNWIGNQKETSCHTTPESSDLQDYFSRMKNRGIKNAVMEVSSHALALERVSGTCFDTVVFTNLTQDHLEFHKTMENYFQAKSRLFQDLRYSAENHKNPLGLINRDDPWGEKLKSLSTGETWTYGLNREADLRAVNVRMSLSGTDFQLLTPAGALNIHSPLVGMYNVYNLTAAAGVGIRHSLPLDVIGEIFERTQTVPGRLEKVPGQYPFSVFVDYAHTEDALLKILTTLDEIKKGRLILVFGCGGNRDRGKRPKMGQVAGRLADCVILTSDNPRHEDPVQIIKEIEDGIFSLRDQQKGDYQVVVNRKEAIECAIREARPEDMVIIAGKGHEDYQIIGDGSYAFNDQKVAKEVLENRFGF